MAETGVLFVAQNMVIGDHRNAAVFLRIQAADPRQTVAHADLKPGLVESVFQLAENGIAQV
ncbi:hypothetical protein D3C81_2281910 [compost metagenome]